MPKIHIFPKERLESLPPEEVKTYGNIVKNYLPAMPEEQKPEYQKVLSTIGEIQAKQKGTKSC